MQIEISKRDLKFIKSTLDARYEELEKLLNLWGDFGFSKEMNLNREVINKFPVLDESIKTCCFSGHRPKSLPWGYNEDSLKCQETKNKLFDAIRFAIEELNCKNFITGMALGTDIWCAEMILNLKKEYKDLTLECAVPCREQYLKWSVQQKARYLNILQNANEVTLVNKDYSETCMKERNQYMIDHSDVLIALYDEKLIHSGTGQTINMAKEKGLKIITINPCKIKEA